jgi:hypothetical protein
MRMLSGKCPGMWVSPWDAQRVAHPRGRPTMRGEVCAAGLLLFEHIWAIGLKEATKHAGGVAVAGGYVAPEVRQALEADREAGK